jgi:sulfate/thiosulfate transport system substrate-binding protein
MNRRQFITTAAAGAAALPFTGCAENGRQLLNCSYDATRELYRKINRKFVEQYTAAHGTPVRITPSHGGSGSQARAVIDGLPADVVTLAMWPDTYNIAKKALIKPDWEKRFPSRSCPYTSTIVFVVRKGNPHDIHDWSDIGKRDDVRVVAANPKTSGAAKLGVIACWGSVTAGAASEAEYRERTAEAETLVTAVYRKVPSLEVSSRAASVTFARKQIGDVQLTWENEAYLVQRESKDGLEIVYPKSGSLLAEPHVAVVDANVERNGTADLATAYLEFLYSPVAQDVIAENYFRPTTDAAVVKFADRFPAINRFAVDRAVRFVEKANDGWVAAQKLFFDDGGLFDRVYKPAS